MVSIPSKSNGVEIPNAPNLSSQCQVLVNGNATASITLPLGGNSGFVGTDIDVYNSSNCSGAKTNYRYEHGIGEKKNFSMTDGIKKSALSMNQFIGFTDPFLQIKGIWTNQSTTPSSPDEGDIYYYNGSNMMSCLSLRSCRSISH